jgi:photosystem II stability/assembly factor-like uncharacterized protein
MVVLRSSRILRLILCAAFWLGCPGSEGGRTLDPAPAWPVSDLVAVAVIDADHVIVVAATGEIYHTSDSGRSWQHADLPVVAGLRSVSMADRKTGWVVGDGVILRTDEGGSSWRHQRLPERADRVGLVSVSAIDSLHAIVIGEAGERLRTEDGGRTWRDVSEHSADPSERPIAMSDVFCDPAAKGRCWSVGQTIRRTSDAGRIWEHVEIEDIARVDPIVFGPGGVEVASLEAERFERFLSANRHRTHVNWQIEPGIGSRDLEQVGRRRDPEALFELIDARLEEVRSMIEEAGISSHRVLTAGAPPWDYEDYLDDDPDFLDRYWTARSAASPSVRVRIVDAPTLFSLRVGTRGFGLAVGAAGAVLRSENSGDDWVMAERLSAHDLLAVGMGRRRVVAVGRQGGLWLSEDEGLSWQAPTRESLVPFFDALRAVSFSPDGEFGIIVGDRGRVLRSFDGGANWALLTSDGS